MVCIEKGQNKLAVHPIAPSIKVEIVELTSKRSAMALPLHYQHEKERKGPQARIGLDHYIIALCTFDRSLRKLMHTFKRHVHGIRLYLLLIAPPVYISNLRTPAFTIYRPRQALQCHWRALDTHTVRLEASLAWDAACYCYLRPVHLNDATHRT